MKKNNLKKRREELSLTQKQVAELVGIHWQLYQKYEYGEKLPNVARAIQIARALDTKVEELFSDTTHLNRLLSNKIKAKEILSHYSAKSLIDELENRKFITVTRRDNVFTVEFKKE